MSVSDGFVVYYVSIMGVCGLKDSTGRRKCGADFVSVVGQRPTSDKHIAVEPRLVYKMLYHQILSLVLIEYHNYTKTFFVLLSHLRDKYKH
jgi:hypothetical protein